MNIDRYDGQHPHLGGYGRFIVAGVVVGVYQAHDIVDPFKILGFKSDTGDCR